MSKKKKERVPLKDRFLLGQYYDGDSFVHKLDPRTKIIITVLYMVVLFIGDSALFYGVMAGVFAFMTALSRIPVKVIFRGMKVVIVLMLFTVIANFFFTSGEVLWQLGFIKITYEGIIRGWVMGLRLILLVGFASILTLTTKPFALTDGLESLGSPLKKIGFPVHEIAMMMSIALRFIPTILEELERIMDAQRARGAKFSEGGIVQKAKALVPLMVPLFVSAIRRADELAQAMEAKCYDGSGNRSNWKPLKWRTADFIIMAFFIVLLVMPIAFPGIL